MESGTVREEKGWKLSRTAPGLFRLDAPDLSVLIQTAPFLLKKGGKIQGVIQLSEGSLCRMIHRGATPVDLIVSSENLDPAFMEEFQLKGKSLEEKDVLPSTESIREFSPFDLHSVLAKSGSHIIAHILLNASRDAAVKILGSLSRRAMESVLLDLKGLIDTSGSRELFPQSRIFPLQETDGALLRFREILRDHRVQQERKRKRGGSQETVVSQ